MNKKLLGKRIKELRKRANYTQDQLSEKIGIETSTLSGIESGRHFPSLHTLEKISVILETELKMFFDFDHLKNMEEMKKNIIKKLDFIDEKTIAIISRVID